MIWKRDAQLAYAVEDPPTGLVGRASVLHLTPHDVAASIAMARAAKQSGTIVSVDIDNVFDGVEVLLPLVDILIASAEFPARLLGAAGIAKPSRSLRSDMDAGRGRDAWG